MSDGETSTVSNEWTIHKGENTLTTSGCMIAVDPGKTTGIAMWDLEVGSAPYTAQLSVDEFFQWVRDTLVDGHLTHTIVCESFVISQRTVKGTSQTWSLEHIGLLKWAAWLRQHDITLQAASAAKHMVPNDRLREVGWYVPGRDHANDALRHMLVHAVRRGVITL